MAKPDDYARVAMVSAHVARVLFTNLMSGHRIATSRGGELLHDDAVRITVAVMPTIVEDILADPDIMEPEDEIAGQEGVT